MNSCRQLEKLISHAYQKKGKVKPKKVMSQSAEKIQRGTLLLQIGFVVHDRGFGCVRNQVLSTNGKNTHYAQKVDYSE